MIALGIAHPAAVERRSAAPATDYTAQALSRIWSRASAVAEGATAGVQNATERIARQFQSAQVEGDGGALTPAILGLAARAMLLRGEFAALLRLDSDGRPVLLAADTVDVFGGPDPRAWRYRVTLAGPSSTETVEVEAGGVVHAIADADTRAPWRGRGVLRRASVSAALDQCATAALVCDTQASGGYIVPMPHGVDERVAAHIRADIEAAAGRLLLPETMMSGGGDGRIAAPAADWKQSRIGPAPPDELVDLADRACMAIGMACGLPPGLLDSKTPAAGAREAWRQFVVNTVEPMARVLSAAASAALETPVRITWPVPPDHLVARARAAKALRDAGLEPGAAREAAGL